MARLILLLLLLPLTALGVNRTSTALSNGEQYLGDCERVDQYPSIIVYLKASTAGKLYVQFSHNDDCSTIDSNIPFSFLADTNEFHRITVTRPYARMMVLNDSGSNQTYLRAGMLKGDYTNVTTFNSSTISQDADTVAVRSIDSEVDIPQGKYAGYLLVNKFGRNPDIGTATDPEDVWDGGGTYTGFPTGTPEAVEVLSSSPSDDEGGAGAEKVHIYGLDASGLLQDEVITLNGTTPVDSAGTYSRVFRAVVEQSANGANTAFNVGTITIRHTTTTANVFIVMQAGKNQSEVACYTIPSNYIGIMKRFDFAVTSKTSVSIDTALWVRESGKAPRLIQAGKATDTYHEDELFWGGLVFPASTDICLRAVTVSANSTEVTGRFDLILVKQ